MAVEIVAKVRIKILMIGLVNLNCYYCYNLQSCSNRYQLNPKKFNQTNQKKEKQIGKSMINQWRNIPIDRIKHLS